MDISTHRKQLVWWVQWMDVRIYSISALHSNLQTALFLLFRILHLSFSPELLVSVTTIQLA